MKSVLTLGMLAVTLSAPALLADEISTFERLPNPGANRFYVSERAPLAPTALVPLPSGAVQPRGWVKTYLERQRDGLTGHLGEISSWLQKQDSAWLNKSGKGQYGWEELPYWLRGYIELAYALNDAKMKAEVMVWIEGVLASQRENGDFGPDQHFDDDGSRDYWANMLMLYCLQTYHERTADPRVLELMTKYFHYQLTVPDSKFLTHYWQHMRGADNLYSVFWLYNRTGDAQLLELAKKIDRRTANWRMKDNLPNWHNVNIAQSFREPAEMALLTHLASDTEATYADFREIRKRFGQVPGGMYGGDEVSRPGFSDPRQATETCGFVEQMLSDEILMQITGDPFWGDQCETVAFNSYPASVMPDFRSLRYLTSPNMAVSDSENHAPGVFNGGPFLLMNPFSSRCCQHNHSMGWPYFNRNLWMATADNGLCAALYSACEVTAKVGSGQEVTIKEDTHYPFEESIHFQVSLKEPANFPISWRIPAWCQQASLSINGRKLKIKPTPAGYVRVNRTWKNGDRVVLNLPMQISVDTWTANHDSVSVNYGPLTFSLKIGERFERKDSTKTAIGDSSWQPNADPSQWPSFEIHPTTPWNYGLKLDPRHPAASFKISRRPWPKSDFPFTPEEVPIQMSVKAQKIPSWTLDRFKLVATLQPSPALTQEPVETVALIPMGAARLRISAFPTVTKEAKTGHAWAAPSAPKPPKYQASSSHTYEGDSTDSLSDGFLPSSSNDDAIPRFTWWPRTGSTEWVQYDFKAPKQISKASVYWFDDTGTGRCRIPASARLLYKSGNEWLPVPGGELGLKKDGMNPISFPVITTTALRLEAQLQPQYSGGLYELEIGN